MTETINVGAGPSGNRRVQILGGIAALLILVVVVLPRLGGGGGGDSAADLASPEAAPGAGAVTTTTTTSVDLSQAVEVRSGKNPFTPLASSAAAAASPGTAVVTGTPPVEQVPLSDEGFAFPVDDGTAFAEDSGSDPAPTDAGPPQPPPRQPDRVSLLEVFTDPGNRLIASIRVNDTTYLVGRGEDFAVSYRVLEIDGASRCATLLFGDDRFSLCEGEELFK